jgi:polysaccharide biosynthesis protein PslG
LTVHRSALRVFEAFVSVAFMTLPTPPASAQPSGTQSGLQPGPQPGVVSDVSWGISRSETDQTIDRLVDAGVKWVRLNVNWKDLEPSPGRMDPWWVSTIDYAVGRLRAKSIDILMPIADGVPYWASADPRKYIDSKGVAHWNQYWRPSSDQDYAAFVALTVGRYGPRGIWAYEIWNEPNWERFWPSGPSAADYVRLLKPAYAAVKKADPRAVVVLGGLSTNDSAYLSDLYAAGAGPYFDVAAVHPYTGATSPDFCWIDQASQQKAADAFCAIESVHKVMADHGDGAKSIWLTEFGWSTCPGKDGVSEQTQAEYLTLAFDQLRRYPYVTVAFFYSFRDYAGIGEGLEAHYGLLLRDFTEKPAYLAFKAYASSPHSGHFRTPY